MTTAFYHDERCLWHSWGEAVLTLPVGGYVQPPAGTSHLENPETKRRFKNLLEVSGLWDHLDVRKADPVTVEDILRVHTQPYVDLFRETSANGTAAPGKTRLMLPGSFESASLSAGLVKRAVADVLSRSVRNAYALARPPGHHAEPVAGTGLCLLANIAIALEAARAEHGSLRVAVLDWDVHHGNGTETIYYERDDTLTISIHQAANYPVDRGKAEDRGRGAGEGFNINIPLLPGGGHQSYLDAFERIVAPAIRRFAPDLIVVACGFDANGLDPMGRMLATSETFRSLAEDTLALAEELCDGRLVCAHEGGYSEAMVPFCGLAVVETLVGHRTDVVDPLADDQMLQQPPGVFIELQRTLIDAQTRDLGLA
jgi:acetoin utilization deacetylase AcuC-like enzyme